MAIGHRLSVVGISSRTLTDSHVLSVIGVVTRRSVLILKIAVLQECVNENLLVIGYQLSVVGKKGGFGGPFYKGEEGLEWKTG